METRGMTEMDQRTNVLPLMSDAGGRHHHAASLPNLLTYGRIAAIPAIVLLMYSGGTAARWTALALFILASITDFFDGYLARVWQQQSSLGRMLDPIADKLLVAAILLMLVSDATIAGVSLFAAIIILTREILVSGLREFLAEVQVSVPVTNLSKWKTSVQMVALGFLLAGPAGEAAFGAVSIGLVLLFLSALLTLYTGYDYFRSGLKHVIEDER